MFNTTIAPTIKTSENKQGSAEEIVLYEITVRSVATFSSRATTLKCCVIN